MNISTEWLDLFGALIQAFIAVITAIAAGLSLYAVKELKKDAKSILIFNCQEKYLDINRQKTTAIQEKSVEKSRDYFREIIDLQWLQVEMWRNGYIDRHIMRSWLIYRKHSYDQEMIRFERNGEVHQITYREIWHNLVDGGYFPGDDTFIDLMNMVHRGEIEKALKLYGKRRKRKADKPANKSVFKVAQPDIIGREFSKKGEENAKEV